MSELVPCPTCDRHVQESADSCPFCGGPMRDRLSVTLRTPDEELSAPVYGAPPMDARLVLPVAPGRRRGGLWFALVLIAAMALGFAVARAAAGP